MRTILIIQAGETTGAAPFRIPEKLRSLYEFLRCETVVEAGRLCAKIDSPCVLFCCGAEEEYRLRHDLAVLREYAGNVSIVCLLTAPESPVPLAGGEMEGIAFVRAADPREGLEESLRRALGGADRDSGLANDFAEGHGPRAPRPSTLLGASAQMRETRRILSLYAMHQEPLIILGETGTGKELAARSVHDQSSRSHGPFVALNCATLTEHLAESELFGTEPGAFTGATKRSGAFEAARGGTLFLDELAELPATVQAKLLRAVEEKSSCRMGSSKNIRHDIRFIAATNAQLHRDANGFRQDLLNRLNTLAVEMPPLRNRLQDLPELISHFIRGLPRPKRISCDALVKLFGWHWPGNVRELKNVVTRASILAHASPCVEACHIVTFFGRDD